ncbi:MAG: hypothetical protein HW403_443 [Dehalococcoidia bacterium]|nr:hypothetical protein [Dehalococcoidia bacterium]
MPDQHEKVVEKRLWGWSPSALTSPHGRHDPYAQWVRYNAEAYLADDPSNIQASTPFPTITGPSLPTMPSVDYFNHKVLTRVVDWFGVRPRSSQAYTGQAIESLQDRFNRLANQWHEETGMYSLEIQKISHPAYLQIIARGRSMLPYILRDLKTRGGLWYQALEAINDGVSPVRAEDEGDVRRMKVAWLQWGREQGLID